MLYFSLMIFNLFQKEVLPPFVTEIIKKRLKREINHSQLTLEDKQFTSYIASTNKGFLNIDVSQNNYQLEIEKAVFSLCQTKNIPIPKIILYEKMNYSKMPLFLMIKEMKGKPFAQERMHLFDFNRVLSQLAEILLKLHQNQFSNFGFLNSDLRAQSSEWHTFLNQTLDEELRIIYNSQIFSKETRKIIEENVFFKPEKRKAVLLHGNIRSSSIYINDNLKITGLTNFKQPLAGDPHYELAEFLVYDGFDRAKRLIRRYNSLGGLIEWDSLYFLQISLRRALMSLSCAINRGQSNLAVRLIKIITQLVARL